LRFFFFCFRQHLDNISKILVILKFT